MSGGSFDYLYQAYPEQLFGRTNDLREMAGELTNRGYADAALETEQVLRFIEHAERQISARQAALQDVWKAVEWVCSADWGEERLDNAINAYRGQANNKA